MYNKISSIILNSGKAVGLSDVYIAQPDALKESLAGKIFVIAEVGAKKTEGRKIFDFLIASLENNYYNDEKIMLRDKIEGLKIENIFEAAIAKTNKDLAEFLAEEKIKLNAPATSLTIGVIFENKLYFSGFGKNRALLIYRRGDRYEVVNVEASATDIETARIGDESVIKSSLLFSSVISGEIPTGSFFVFASESLLEYVSNKDLADIITKLPPIVASEQIKNILGRINSFVPFLGIIIKNTMGLDNQEVREEPEENLTAHSSIYSLNYTEQKTERMLAPAGLISVSKISGGIKRIVKSFKPAVPVIPKKVYRAVPEEKSPSPIVDLGQVKSMNIARPDSFLIKEKIFFKKKPNLLGVKMKQAFGGLAGIFRPRNWSGLGAGVRNWFGNLGKKNRLLFIALTAVIVVFIASVGFTNWHKKQQAVENNYNNLVATIGEKRDAIDSFLLYNNEEGARSALIEAQALLSYLPRDSKKEIAAYDELAATVNAQADKIQKIVKIGQAEKVLDLSGLAIANIVFADGKIYAAGGNTIYGLTPQSSSSTRFEVAGVSGLINPQFDRKSIIYYWDNGQLIRFSLKDNRSAAIKVAPEFNNNGLSGFKVFGGNLYILAKDKNQIYRLSLGKDGYTNKADWLKSQADLSFASDLAIDGNIYVLKSDGQVMKFYLGKPVDFGSTALSPAMASAGKIIVGSKYIYVFEAGSKRLAVLAIKDGHLMNQYQVDSLSQPKDFAVDETGKAAYFLDGESVYKITLNQ